MHSLRKLWLVFGLLCLSHLAFAYPITDSTANPIKTKLLQLAATRFEEPLVETAATSSEEDTALLGALGRQINNATDEENQSLNQFLASHPKSGWAMALYANLGLQYYRNGRFSKAIESFETAWKVGKSAQDPRAKALVDRAFGELMRMHARIGHADKLEGLLKELGGRAVTGPATEAVTGANEGLWLMRHEPGIAFLCGPMALKNLLLAQGAKAEDLGFIEAYRSSPKGVSLTEVDRLANQAKLAHKIIHRSPGQAIPVPAVVHWKVGHYAAIVSEANGYYHLQDPTFGEDLWVTKSAIDSEASGYYLVPSARLDKGWRAVQLAEASQIRGMGLATASQASATTPDDEKAKPDCKNKGMCGYNVHEMLMSLNLTDTPVGYAPPKGPSVFTTLTYNQREAGQPANFPYFNVSQKWTINWLSFIQDDPAVAGASVKRFVAGGGSIDYTGYNSTTAAFAAERTDASVLVRTLASPITYERRMSDGSVEVYAQSNGASVAPRRVFLTKIIDPAGNALTLNYDTQNRLATITDAIGRNTTFTYGHATNPLLITTITDPFTRKAILNYDANGRLQSIKDAINLSSSFTYNANGYIDSMTTPYGITSFATSSPTNDNLSRWLEVTDPLLFKERFEYKQALTNPSVPATEPSFMLPQGIIALDNNYLNYANSYYWDKHAYQSGVADYAKARIKRWTMISHILVGNTVASLKYPLESRIWYNYPGQPTTSTIGSKGSNATGTLDKPSRAARILDDGSTQLTQTEYNALGNVTREIDGEGREVVYEYFPNQIDLQRIKRKTSATGYSVLAEFTYNAKHRPLTYKDAAGQITNFNTYNAAGQLTHMTNALNEGTTFVYSPLGYLTDVINANNQTVLTLTYYATGNVKTRTDSEGHVTTYTYDNFDRLLQTTYPDGTFTLNTYDKLDLKSVKDRLNRITSYDYDANRNLFRVTDPLLQTVDYDYYRNGTLKTLTDGNNHITTWNRDIQSRVTTKQIADGINPYTFIYTYEGLTSRLKQIGDPLGQSKRMAYGKDNLLKSILYLSPVNPTPNVSFVYDPYFPRITGMTDGLGTTQYQYHPVGVLGAEKLSLEDGPFTNDTIAYQYDELGRVNTRTIDTAAETFHYDPIGRIDNHTSALGNFDRSYLGETGQITGQHSMPPIGGSSVGTDWVYDTNLKDRQLLNLVNSGATRNYTYTRTPEDRIDQIVESATAGSGLPAQTWVLDYDDTDRLKSSQSIAGGTGRLTTYNYDPADNLTQAALPGGTTNFGINTVNQITTRNAVAVSYDKNGNMVDDGVKTYTWDAENRLIKAANKANPTTTNITFKYDGLSRPIVIDPSPAVGDATRSLWCGEALCQRRNEADTVIRRYFSEGEVRPAAAANKRLYYARDHLGSVREVLDADSGVRLGSLDYDPYGLTVSTNGTIFPDFRYAGMYFLQGWGLYQTHYRVYDANVTYRWLNRDPIQEVGGINLYSFVGGNPVNWIDPLGLSTVTIPFPDIPIPNWMPEWCRILGARANIFIAAATIPGDTQQCDNGCQDNNTSKRPKNFRKKTLQDSWDNASQGSLPGTKACPKCGKDVAVPPNEGTPRDWDNHHDPKWKDRDLTGKNRKEVLDDFNKGTSLLCPGCNRSDNQ